MRRSGQCLFLPRAMFKQREKESGRSLFDQRGGDLYVGKPSWAYSYDKVSIKVSII